MAEKEFRPVMVHATSMSMGVNQICEGRRVFVHGKASMTLMPDVYVVDMYNLSDEEMAILKTSEYINVVYDPEGRIGYGEIADIYTHKKEANTVTSVLVVDGKEFSETVVSMSVGGGASVHTAMASIINGSGITRSNGSLGAFLAPDVRLIRGQVFSGKLMDCVSTLARAANARAFFTTGTVIVTTKGRAENYLRLSEDDVVDEPSFTDGACIVRTKMKSFAVGTIITYRGKQYRLASMVTDADNYEGMWRLELTLVNEDDIDTYGMEGG